MRASIPALAMLLLVGANTAAAFDLEGRFVTLSSPDGPTLSRFNKNVKAGLFSSLFANRSFLTQEEEVLNKVEQITTRVQQVLEMAPPGMRFKVSLMNSPADVQQVYRQMYNRSVDFIAFYSPQANTVFIAVDEVNLRVVAHEIAHAVINHYFQNAPPVKIHEMLAQYVESQVDN